jgi:CoA:oxalate CoA-transferase
VCATDQHWARLTEAMERPDLGADESLHRLQGRIARIDEVTGEIGKWTATRTRDEIGAVCEKHGVAAAPLRDVTEVLTDPHLRARGFLTLQETEHGPVSLPNSPMRYEGSALRPLAPPPGLGQHTDTVLSELCGLDEAALGALRRDKVI